MQLASIDKTKEWTVTDYDQLGEEHFYQLINGELIVSPSSSLTHQRISNRLTKILTAFAEETGGEHLYTIDVYLDHKNVVQPDHILISKENLGKLKERGVEGAPDLAVEILSPSNSHIDRYHKKEIYQQFGVKEYWMIDPNNQTIEMLNFTLDPTEPVLYLAEEGLVKSSLFPKLQFELAALF